MWLNLGSCSVPGAAHPINARDRLIEEGVAAALAIVCVGNELGRDLAELGGGVLGMMTKKDTHAFLPGLECLG
jgi:hypothetical protein